MLVGSAFAAVHGVSFPILAMVFGQMTNTFLNFTQPMVSVASLAPWR